MRKLLLVLSVVLGAAFSVQGALHLTVDLETDEVFFSGSDSGTPNSAGIMAWSNGGGSLVNGLNFMGSTPFLTSPQPNRLWQGGMGALSNNSIHFSIHLFGNTPVTVVAVSSVRFSYADWSAAAKDTLEQLAVSQGTLPLTSGTGFSAVTTSAVPEPSIWALVALAAATVFWSARHRLARYR